MLKNIKKLRQFLTRRELFQLGAILIAIVAMAFTQAIGVASVLPFIGLVMDPEIVFENRWLLFAYEKLNFTGIESFIIFVGIAMFAIILISNAIAAITTWLKIKFAWMNNHRLSRRLLDKYLSMPYNFFLNQNSSDLSKNVLAEVNQLTSSYLLPMLNLITRGLIVLFILIMLLWVDFLISLAALFVLGGTYAAVYWYVNKNLEVRGAKRLEANKMRYKAVNEAFGGIKEIKVLNREPFFLESYSGASLKHAQLMSWNAVIGQIPRFALEAIAFGGIILFVLVLLLTKEDARQVIPLAGLFGFAGYRLMPSLQDIFTSFTQFKFNQAVLDRIYQDFMAGEESEPSSTEIVNPSPFFKKEIRLKDISYEYPNSNIPVIKEINLAMKQNSAIAFVGPTGSGKTTLVDIILGLLTPQQGNLLVDEVPIEKSNLKNWQTKIGYVPQQIYLSDDTVAHNIAFGIKDSEIDRAAVERAARVANIYDFIVNELPQGFDTLVGERGIRLSGGQRQRIGIARALYHDPSLLIFDEATSALDGITEEAVLGAMENAAEQKTMVMIAHRLTTVKNCDTVYILDKGQIVGSGTYEELLAENEQFKAMARSGK
jgi:ATP-binding cassette, subfamily B, bacterial PglK